MERQTLSIRQFAEVCGVSHTEISRKMKTLNIKGMPQGKGKPTLLSPAEQDALAQALFTPAPDAQQPIHRVQVLGPDLSVYQPATLATQGTDASLSRQLQGQQLALALGRFKANHGSFRSALLSLAAENGRQLGHEMHVAEIGAALQEYSALQSSTGKQLGVVADGSESSASPA